MVSGSTGGGSSSLLQSQEDCKYHGRLLSKETSLANPSFRVYYSVAAAGSVPFLWESRPGTPKHTSSAAALPPLTPPPSYFSSSPSRTRTRSSNNNKPGSKYSFLFLPKLLALKKAATGDGAVSMSPSSSLSSSSSSSSSCSSRSDHRRRPSDEDEEAEFSSSRSPTSTLCFGVPIFPAKKNTSV
ncbi:A-agglutinin anchorage subunit-like [Zingiber officinale]|uniref:Uncharacterized protein n=1 Tax=Zingiber officinale TaxID=94328 RepID=A0A8J5HES3_ZINOF|nr:A-agglutinin anchorage subunit-like [Zingiber officinale]KAG6522730.1 hypothetical protein ZIOFF_019881 [Zingiber officinale]